MPWMQIGISIVVVVVMLALILWRELASDPEPWKDNPLWESDELWENFGIAAAFITVVFCLVLWTGSNYVPPEQSGLLDRPSVEFFYSN